MAIPTKPLTIRLDWDKVTLGEACLLRGYFDPVDFRDFLLAHSSWTRHDINLIERNEWIAVYQQMMDRLPEPNSGPAPSQAAGSVPQEIAEHGNAG